MFCSMQYVVDYLLNGPGMFHNAHPPRLLGNIAGGCQNLSWINDELSQPERETKYMRIKPDFSEDEEFRTNKFLVQIVKRKLDHF